MSALRVSDVDAAIDALDDDTNPGSTLADLLDDTGDWDWSDEAEHGPEDRLAVVESTGAWWLVYRGSEPDSADRHASADEAWAALHDQAKQITERASP